ncbi:helix-turn-helix transcriptional regulator [Lysinibacillus sp. FSL H8-0500]|uniref:helix-turn-helix domain-containing protein n=1 Tax=Lysinibacillus sp. FSL H8-0500 TaxID=2921393 RepID=UPI003100F96A
MDTSMKVKRLLLEKNMNITQLAKKIETSQPNLSKKLQNNSLSVADLEKIAAALDVKFDLYFILENGEKI